MTEEITFEKKKNRRVNARKRTCLDTAYLVLKRVQLASDLPISQYIVMKVEVSDQDEEIGEIIQEHDWNGVVRGGGISSICFWFGAFKRTNWQLCHYICKSRKHVVKIKYSNGENDRWGNSSTRLEL